jgi:hypothetical protein
MADPTIKTSTRPIKGITTRIEVNTDTGSASLYQDNGIFGRTLLATGSAVGNKWTVNDNFRALYSTRVGSTLTLAQAQNAFTKDFQSLSNDDRASLINTWSQYNTKTYLATKAKIPGIIDPKTGLKTGQTLQTQQKGTDPQKPGTQPPLAPGPSANPDPSLSSGVNVGGATLSSFSKFSDNEKANYRPAILSYPIDHAVDYDYLMIQPIEYVPGFGVGAIGGLTVERASTRISRQKVSTGPRIYLPMTPGISESNSVGWGSDELNPIQLAFGRAANDAITTARSGQAISAIQNLFNDLGTTATAILNDPKLSTAVASYFAGQAVGANFLGRSGIVLNPNLELLFQGPKLRSFRYNFKFTPRNDKEAKEIRRIIKVFKKTMAVRQSPGSLFLGVPSIYELRYIFNSDETGDHPFLNKIKPCALTGFNVNYTPDGSYMTYQDGSMTSYAVDMQFDEIEPIYNEDIGDVDSVTMGY